MQIAVWFWWKSRDDFVVAARVCIDGNDLADKVSRLSSMASARVSEEFVMVMSALLRAKI